MDAPEPPDGPTLLEPGDEVFTEGEALTEVLPAAAPPIVAVVVTRNPEPGLDDTLRSLAAQDYPDLTILVIDVASDDDPTPRIADVLPGAYVKRLAESVGFAGAANEALVTVEGAAFLFLCHDDVVLDPSAIRIMLEEAYRSNAGIVGPKLVDADNPEILLEVGRSIDRFGGAHTGIEPGELDQEQHDAVRDVFYVSSAALLVRADLFTELGGFDPATFPGSEDLDLCWRARLAGARVLVAPDARVRHREASVKLGETDEAELAAVARTRVRVLLTSYSKRRLAWLVPVGLLMALVEAVIFAFTRRRMQARAVLGAWAWNLRHYREVRESRRRAQALRRIHDRDLHELQARGNERLRAFLAESSGARERIQALGDVGRTWVEEASSGLRQPTTIAACFVAVLGLIGSRELILTRVPEVGSLAAWPGVGSLLDTFGSGWRYTGMGSSTPAPPVLLLMSALGTVFLGAVGLARTLVIVGALPLGGIAAYHFSRPIVRSRVSAVLAGLAYVVNPVSRNALANGRLGPLVLYALTPFLALLLLRAADVGRETAPRSARRPKRGAHDYRPLLALIGVTALASAWYPLAFLVPLAVAVAFLIAVPLARDGVAMAGRAVRVAVLGGLGALVLLLPWSVAMLHPGVDGAALGVAYRSHLDVGAVLRFQSGPSGSGLAAYGLLIAGALVLVMGSRLRLAWAARAWALALLGWALVWVPGRFFGHVSMPASEVGLTIAALGLALAIGLGADAFGEGLTRFRFGWRQPAGVLAAIALALTTLGFAADALDGRWHAPASDWPRSLAVLQPQQADGDFRVLWVGDPSVLPLDPAVRGDGVGYLLTTNGSVDAGGLWRAPERRADRVLGAAVDLAATGRTNRLGHLVAPMGVRYIALPERRGSGSGPLVPGPAGIAPALGQQLDLSLLKSDPGVTLYENSAWVPARSVAPPGAALALHAPDPAAAASSTDVVGARPISGQPSDGGAAGPGTVLWSQAYDGRWHASANGQSLRHVQPFDLVNGFVLPKRGPTAITYSGQWQRALAILVQVLLWAGFVVLWRRSRRGARRAAAEVRA
jgi:GT2 family glycosyltransferase